MEQNLTEQEKKMLLNTVKIAVEAMTKEEYNKVLKSCRDIIEKAIQE